MKVWISNKCEQEVKQKLGKCQEIGKIKTECNTEDPDSDSEDEFMDAMEEIPKSNSSQSLLDAIKTGCQVMTGKIMQLKPLGNILQNNDVTLDCDDHKNETHETNINQTTAQLTNTPKNEANSQH